VTERVAERAGAGADVPPPRVPILVLFAVLRWLAAIGVLLMSLLALGWVGAHLGPDWMPARRLRDLRVLDSVTDLVLILGALVAGVGVLTGIRRWERQAREARYKALARVRNEADRGRAEQARVDAGRPGGAEAILVLDLIQSTELIREQGDEFFRDLLRRIETAFIPIARQHGTRGVDGHGDGFLFCFDRADQALEALREMYGRLPVLNQALPADVDVAFRATLHVGPTFADTRGNRTGLAVLKTVRLGGVMETLKGRGAGRNSLVISEEARDALHAAGISATLLGHVPLRGFPGTHPVYETDISP
jgi:class 3 adenylate cyclase